MGSEARGDRAHLLIRGARAGSSSRAGAGPAEVLDGPDSEDRDVRRRTRPVVTDGRSRSSGVGRRIPMSTFIGGPSDRIAAKISACGSRRSPTADDHRPQVPGRRPSNLTEMEGKSRLPGRRALTPLPRRGLLRAWRRSSARSLAARATSTPRRTQCRRRSSPRPTIWPRDGIPPNPRAGCCGPRVAGDRSVRATGASSRGSNGSARRQPS